MSHRDRWIEVMSRSNLSEVFWPNRTPEELGNLYDNINTWLAENGFYDYPDTSNYLSLAMQAAEGRFDSIPDMKVSDFNALDHDAPKPIPIEVDDQLRRSILNMVIQDGRRRVCGMFKVPLDLLGDDYMPSTEAAKAQLEVFRRAVERERGGPP